MADGPYIKLDKLNKWINPDLYQDETKLGPTPKQKVVPLIRYKMIPLPKIRGQQWPIIPREPIKKESITNWGVIAERLKQGGK